MKPNRWQLPKIEQTFNGIPVAELFSKMGLYKGYLQVGMSEACKERTTFVSRYGKYKFEVMPFGLINAPAKFRRMKTRYCAG